MAQNKVQVFDLEPPRDASRRPETRPGTAGLLRYTGAGITALLALLVLVDLIITTDKERLLAGARDFANAASENTPELVTNQLADDFQFVYQDVAELNRQQFIENYRGFCEFNPKVDVESIELKIDGDGAAADVTYMLFGEAAMYLNGGKLGQGAPAKVRLVWRRDGGEWKVTLVELHSLADRKLRIPITLR